MLKLSITEDNLFIISLGCVVGKQNHFHFLELTEDWDSFEAIPTKP